MHVKQIVNLIHLLIINTKVRLGRKEGLYAGEMKQTKQKKIIKSTKNPRKIQIRRGVRQGDKLPFRLFKECLLRGIFKNLVKKKM